MVCLCCHCISGHTQIGKSFVEFAQYAPEKKSFDPWPFPYLLHGKNRQQTPSDSIPRFRAMGLLWVCGGVVAYVRLDSLQCSVSLVFTV